MGYGRQYTKKEAEAIKDYFEQASASPNSISPEELDAKMIATLDTDYDTAKKSGPFDGVKFVGVPLGPFRNWKETINAPKTCDHEMKEYVGLFETDRYCTKCPYKERA